MSVATANPRVRQGDNNPPKDDPFEAFTAHIGDLFAEASNFLDGAAIRSDGEADQVSRLLEMIRTAARDADKARAAEKKPHDDAGKAVQAKWKPLLDRAELAVTTCKRALAPWLQAKEAAASAAAEVARAEAEAKARKAAEAMRATTLADLAGREEAEALVKDAKAAEAAASRAEKARPQASGDTRAVTLRTSYRPELANASEALKHYVAREPEAIKACLLQLAQADVRRGVRTIPGFNVLAEQSVV